MGGGTLVDFSLLKLLKPAYDDSFVMVRALASTRNETSRSVKRAHARLLVCPSPQKFGLCVEVYKFYPGPDTSFFFLRHT